MKGVHVRPLNRAVHINFVAPHLAMGRPMTYLIAHFARDRSKILWNNSSLEAMVSAALFLIDNGLSHLFVWSKLDWELTIA